MQRLAASAELRDGDALNSDGEAKASASVPCNLPKIPVNSTPAAATWVSGSLPQQPLTWSVHLLREAPAGTIGIAAAALFVIGAAFALFHSLIPGIVAALLLLVSVAEYLLPVKFTLDGQRAQVCCGPVEWLSIEWKSVRSVYRTPYGIKLSPFADPQAARMERCRGVRLRVPRALLAQVESAISSYRGNAGQ